MIKVAELWSTQKGKVLSLAETEQDRKGSVVKGVILFLPYTE
jgi:hypothetical protein